MKLSIAITLLILATSQVVNADRVFFEQALGEVTSGYDPKSNRTLISVYNAVATGPDKIEDPAVALLTEAAKKGLSVAVGAFSATPGEVAIRFKAGVSAFEASFKQQISGDELAKKYKDSVKLGLVQRCRWEDGLVLRLKTDNPAVQAFREIHNGVKEKFPPVLNQLIELNMAGYNLDVNARINPPAELRNLVVSLPSPEEVERVGRELEDAIKGLENVSDDLGRELSRAVQHEMQKAAAEAQQRAQDEIERARRAVEAAIQKSAAEAAEAARKAAEAAAAAAAAAEKQAREAAQAAARAAEDSARAAARAAEDAARSAARAAEELKKVIPPSPIPGIKW